MDAMQQISLVLVATAKRKMTPKEIRAGINARYYAHQQDRHKWHRYVKRAARLAEQFGPLFAGQHENH
jgi:hypothetical protein